MKPTVLLAGYGAKDSAGLGLALLCGGFSALLAPDLESALVHLRGGRIDAVLVPRKLAESGEAEAQEFRRQAAVWRIPLASAGAGVETPVLVKLLVSALRPQNG